MLIFAVQFVLGCSCAIHKNATSSLMFTFVIVARDNLDVFFGEILLDLFMYLSLDLHYYQLLLISN